MKTMFNRIAFATLALSSFSSVSDAGEMIVLKPLHGITFKAGQTSSVGYFQSERGSCKVVLTYAADESTAPAGTFTVSRHQTLIGSGETTRYSISDQPYEFACHANGEAMTFKALNRFASAE